MKSALVFVTLLSCIFSKYESQLNEDITIKATKINYPEKCTAFPKGTTFDIQYNNTKGVTGETKIKLKTSATETIEAKCEFTSSKGDCATEADVPSSAEIIVILSPIEFTVEEKNVTIDVSSVNDPPKKYNKTFVPLSSSLNTHQNFSFDANNTEAFAADKGIKIDFEKELSNLLKVYKVEGANKTELSDCGLTDNKKTIQCPINTTVFPLNGSDNKTEMNYTLSVENACEDLYDMNITVSVRWGSSHYVKALGLLSLLLVFIL